MPGRRTEPQVAKMSDVGMRAAQQSIERAAQGIDMMEETYKYMVDYGTHKNAQRLLDDATREYDEGMSTASALAPGTPGSLWNDDYSLNEEMLGQLRREYEQKVEGIQPKFLDSRRGFEFEQQRGSVLAKTLERSEGHAHAMQLKMARQGVEDRVENYALHGNYAAACGEIDGAVGAGLMSKVQADTAKLKLAKSRVSGGGRGGSGVSVKSLTDALMRSLMQPEEAQAEAAGADHVRGTMDDVRLENSAAEPHGDGLTQLEVGDGEKEEDEISLDGEAGELGEVKGESLGQLGLAEVKPKEKRIEDIFKVTDEDLRLGLNPFDKPEVLKLGFSAMTPDEVGAEWLNLGTEAAKVKAVDEGFGNMKLDIPEAAEEPMAVVAHAANVRGGMTLEDYRKGAYATMCAVMTNEDFDGLSDDSMKKLMVGRVEIDGLEEQLFADLKEEDRGPAMESMLNGVAENVLSTRRDNIRKRVDEFFAGADGLPGATAVVKGLDDASIGALYKPTEAEQALMDYSWWNRLKTGEAQQAIKDRLAPLLGEYRARYEAETGEELGDNYGKFRDWYEETVIPEKREAYVEEAKWVCTQAAIDAVVEYRRNGGKSWAEENEKMMDAIARARKNLKGGGDIAAWRKGRDAGVAARAAKYREQAEEFAPRLEATRKEYAEAKAERDAQEEARKRAEKERTDWEEGKRRAAQREIWDAELEAQERAAAPYRYPVVREVRYGSDTGEAAVLTVPEPEYMQMLKDLQVGRGEGVVCTFGNGKKQVAVRPGKVKDMTFNLAVIQLLYNNKRLKKDDLKRLVNKHKEELRFKKVLSVN